MTVTEQEQSDGDVRNTANSIASVTSVAIGAKTHDADADRISFVVLPNLASIA